MQVLLKVLFPALISSGLGHTAFVGITVICLVSGRRMQRFLPGCHGLPIAAAGVFAGAAHIDRAHWVCLSCHSGAVGGERPLVFECAPLQFKYAGLLTGSGDTMRSFRS